VAWWHLTLAFVERVEGNSIHSALDGAHQAVRRKDQFRIVISAAVDLLEAAGAVKPASAASGPRHAIDRLVTLEMKLDRDPKSRRISENGKWRIAARQALSLSGVSSGTRP